MTSEFIIDVKSITKAGYRVKPSIEQIERLVTTFYERVREDENLAPVFENQISDWEPHLERMVLFWRSVLRYEATYINSSKGSPRAIHQQLPGLKPIHLAIWLEIFERTANEVFSPELAPQIIHKAQLIGKALTAHLR